MEVTRIAVRNYRNLQEQTVSFSKGINLILGPNAQGKTNLMECVSLCCLGKSQRNTDRELIAWGKEKALVKTEFESRFGKGSISLAYSTREPKKIAVNEVGVSRVAEMLGYLKALVFTPDEIKTIRQGPAERRRFLDVDLCQIDKDYFYALCRYNRILQQRNRLLKESKEKAALRNMLSVWDVSLAKEGTKVYRKRKAFLEQLAPLAEQSHRWLTDEAETLRLSYLSSLHKAPTEEAFCALLERNFERDAATGFTNAGIHRDDISFGNGEMDLRSFGSQGQQRTAALSLKLAEIEIFRQLTGEYPVLLLDDVTSELDLTRQRKLLTFSDKVQILLTATHMDASVTHGLDCNVLQVSNGRITQQP